LKKSTEIMKLVNKLVKLPEIQKTMMELQREMMKAGVIEEMLEDAIDNDDEIEEESEAEVNKVLWEITNGLLGEGPSVPEDKVAEPSSSKVAAEGNEEEEPELEAMQARLAALEQ